MFEPGDRVAWSPEYATQHDVGSVVRAEVVGAFAPSAQYGTVEGVANQEGTHFTVRLDSGDTKVLTFEEIVKVSGDTPAPPETPAPAGQTVEEAATQDA